MLEKELSKNWELIPCEYDYMGLKANAIENPGAICTRWLLGTIINFCGGKVVRVELEGSRENLEYVLKQQSIICLQVEQIKQLKNKETKNEQ